jgi:hypothetical protein
MFHCSVFFSLVVLAFVCLCFQSLLEIEFLSNTMVNIGSLYIYFFAFFHLTSISVHLTLSPLSLCVCVRVVDGEKINHINRAYGATMVMTGIP